MVAVRNQIVIVNCDDEQIITQAPYPLECARNWMQAGIACIFAAVVLPFVPDLWARWAAAVAGIVAGLSIYAVLLNFQDYVTDEELMEGDDDGC